MFALAAGGGGLGHSGCWLARRRGTGRCPRNGLRWGDEIRGKKALETGIAGFPRLQTRKEILIVELIFANWTVGLHAVSGCEVDHFLN